MRDLFVLNYQPDSSEPGSVDDKLESEPWLRQSHSEQELLRLCQRKATHFISVIEQKRSRCNQLVKAIKSYQKSVGFDPNNAEFQGNLHEFAKLTKEVTDIAQEFEAVRHQIEEIHSFAKSDLKKLRKSLSRAELAKKETTPKETTEPNEVKSGNLQPCSRDRQDFERKRFKRYDDVDDNRDKESTRPKRIDHVLSPVSTTPRQDPRSIEQSVESLKNAIEARDLKDLKKAAQGQTPNKSKTKKSDKGSADKPRRKSEKDISRNMNQRDFELLQEQMKTIVSALKQCQVAGDDSPSSDPSDSSSSDDDREIRKRKSDHDKDKVKKSKKKSNSSADRQSPRQSPKKTKSF